MTAAMQRCLRLGTQAEIDPSVLHHPESAEERSCSSQLSNAWRATGLVFVAPAGTSKLVTAETTTGVKRLYQMAQKVDWPFQPLTSTTR